MPSDSNVTGSPSSLCDDDHSVVRWVLINSVTLEQFLDRLVMIYVNRIGTLIYYIIQFTKQ